MTTSRQKREINLVDDWNSAIEAFCLANGARLGAESILLRKKPKHSLPRPIASGVYAIEIGSDLYVGMASDLMQRWCAHLRCMRFGSGGIPKVVESYARHGVAKTAFAVLEVCPVSSLFEAEKRHHLALKPNLVSYHGCRIGKLPSTFFVPE